MGVLVEYRVGNGVTGKWLLQGVNIVHTQTDSPSRDRIEECVRNVFEQLEMYVCLEQLNVQVEIVIQVRLAGVGVGVPEYRRLAKNWPSEDWARMNERLNEILEGVR